MGCQKTIAQKIIDKGGDYCFGLKGNHPWIKTDSQRVGYICFWQSDLEIHVSLIIIVPEKQRNSYGRQIMLHLHDQARESGRKITLSSFKKSEGAIRFYETLGYKIIGSDENFVDMAFTVL